MKHERDLLDLVALYALGSLDEADRARMEHHLAAGCDVCQAALLDAHATAAELATLVEPVVPSAASRAALLARVRADAADARGATRRPRTAAGLTATTSRARRVVIAGALAAAAGLLVVVGARLFALERRLAAESNARTAAVAELENTRSQLEQRVAGLDHTRAQLERQVADLQQSRSQVDERIASAQAALDAITAPGTKPVALAGQGDRKRASATAYLDASAGRLMLFVHDLPTPPPGRTYQLWVIVEGTPVSLGVFDVGEGGRAHMRAEKLPELRGPITIAVTEEPAGGVLKPTGPMVLAGS